MPKGKPTRNVLPDRVKFATVDGEAFARLASAAKLDGVHPDVLEMGRRLFGGVGRTAGVFELGDPQLRARADDLRAAFAAGLKRVARALGPGGLRVVSARDGDRLSFWYAPAGRRKAAKR